MLCRSCKSLLLKKNFKLVYSDSRFDNRKWSIKMKQTSYFFSAFKLVTQVNVLVAASWFKFILLEQRKGIEFKLFHTIFTFKQLVQLLKKIPRLLKLDSLFSSSVIFLLNIPAEYFGPQILGYLSRKPVCVGQNKQGTVNLVYFHSCEEGTLPRCTCFTLFAPCHTPLSQATNGKINLDGFREIK